MYLDAEYEQTIVRFDFRTHDEEDINSWDYSRRVLYLINEDALLPYSVDSAVWSRVTIPSVERIFGSEYGAIEFTNEKLDGLHFVSQNGQNCTFKSVVKTLRRAARRLEFHSKVMVIGYSANLKLAASLFRGFPLLGYDVITGDISGICNCGYYPNEKPKVLEQFGLALNERHLFNNFESAKEFAEFSNVRVPEHAPFTVVAIYRIPVIDELE